MSLIEDALRRVQEHPPETPPPPQRPAAPRRLTPVEDSAHHAPQPAGPPPAAPPAPQPGPRHTRAWLVGALIGLVGVLIVEGWLVWTQGGDLTPTTHPPTAQPIRLRSGLSPEQSRRTQPAPPITVAGSSHSVPLRSKSPRLSLSGVVQGSGEPLAIINGRIVKVGETVEGATLLEVNQDSARLRWHDQELVLRTTP